MEKTIRIRVPSRFLTVADLEDFIRNDVIKDRETVVTISGNEDVIDVISRNSDLIENIFDIDASRERYKAHREDD